MEIDKFVDITLIKHNDVIILQLFSSTILTIF